MADPVSILVRLLDRSECRRFPLRPGETMHLMRHKS